MFQQAGTAQLNDYFRPLSERGGSRVFFCRIAGYGETVAAFLRRYYEAARRSGVIIDGRIPNPTPDNLSYFNEMMGSGFQMDRDFLSQRLKKWLPRMTDGQRDAVVTAMYATLDDMRRAGKNDNMLRNAYMKYMCWLYYKFERIVNVLGGETLPKILYAGDVSHYELQLLTVLSRAGADIVLLECGGDQAYLTVDPQSALSHLYQAPGLGPFPAGFGVKQLQAELEREVRRQRLYGTPPSLSPCTNAWVQKAELNAALHAEATPEVRREQVAALRQALAGVVGAEELLTDADALVEKSVWLIGGDGWAYDIGFGGLDHVLSLTENVNILVLDTQCYSNTGGQASKATPLGAVTKFGEHGKRKARKDLGVSMMMYGHVYVAQISLGAQLNQTVKAIQEAEAYPGPSLIIAYSPCEEHGYDLALSHDQMRQLTATGFWPLYRFDPRRADEGKIPLALDSRPPSDALAETLLNEQRFRRLNAQQPEVAEQLWKDAAADLQKRYDFLAQLAGKAEKSPSEG